MFQVQQYGNEGSGTGSNSWCRTVCSDYFKSFCFTSFCAENKTLRLNSAQRRPPRTGNGWKKHCAQSGQLSLLAQQQLDGGLITLGAGWCHNVVFCNAPYCLWNWLLTHGNDETYPGHTISTWWTHHKKQVYGHVEKKHGNCHTHPRRCPYHHLTTRRPKQHSSPCCSARWRSAAYKTHTVDCSQSSKWKLLKSEERIASHRWPSWVQIRSDSLAHIHECTLELKPCRPWPSRKQTLITTLKNTSLCDIQCVSPSLYYQPSKW